MSFLDQVESRKRRFLRLSPPCGVLCARCASHCSAPPTLPRAASIVLSSCPGERCCIFFFLAKQCLVRSQVCLRSYRYIAVWVYLWQKFCGSAGSSFSAHFWSTFQFPEGVSLFMCYFFTFCIFGFSGTMYILRSTWCVVSKQSSFTCFWFPFNKCYIANSWRDRTGQFLGWQSCWPYHRRNRCNIVKRGFVVAGCTVPIIAVVWYEYVYFVTKYVYRLVRAYRAKPVSLSLSIQCPRRFFEIHLEIWHVFHESLPSRS